MSSERPEIAFNGGDDVIRGVSFQGPTGNPIDASDCNYFCEAWWRGLKQFEMTIGDGLQLLADHPAAGHSHAMLWIDQERTVLPPQGKVSYLKFIFIDSLGIRFSSQPLYLNKRLP